MKPYRFLHGVRINLTHVEPFVNPLHVFDVERPRDFVVHRHGESGIVGNHMVVDG